MEQGGWIAVNRSVTKHWVHDDLEHFGAWVDLLLMANHESRKLPLNGEIILIERGQFFTSYRSLSQRWGWSKDKVNRFLALLEADGMIQRKRDTNGTLLTIVNYRVYQDSLSENATPTRRKRDTGETRIGRNNNDNNENNENNDNNITPLPPKKGERAERYFPNDELLEKTFSDFREMRKKMKAPMTNRAIELMVNKINKIEPDIAVKMLEQSIVKGWKDIYELKNDKATSKESLAEKWGL